ncbi:hypothetical protein QCA50_012360 [Cerrena zonata]|uniref:Uncharacterized protein n=1 Tax=Cerrena zonata TaxID=2478898 RepID=A0AAW0FRZ3_9APHY
MAETPANSRRKLVANLPPGMRTRAQNKTQHPGAPDLPKPRRSHTEVAATNAAEEQARQLDAQARETAIERAAAVENRMLTEDNNDENFGRRPSLPVDKNIPDERLVGSNKDLEGETRGGQQLVGLDDESSDNGSVYEPKSKAEEEASDQEGSDLEQDDTEDSDIDTRASTKKAVKKKAQTARASVQAARFSATNSTGGRAMGKRKLEVEGHGKGLRVEETITKKTKKAEVGGVSSNWEDYRYSSRGRHSSVGSMNTKRSSRAHSNTSTGSAPSSNIDLTLSDDLFCDHVDSDGVRPATFADDSDADERSAMADIIEDARSERRKKQLHQQVDKTKLAGGSRAHFNNVQNLTTIAPKDAPLVGTRRTTRSGKETKKPRNSDLPDNMQERWQKLFVPLARELVGTMLPWASLDLDQVRALFKRTWPSSEYIVQKGDVYWNLITYRITDWRSSIGTSGTAAVDRMISDNAEVLDSSEAIREFVEHNLGDGNQEVPFHWETWTSDSDGKKIKKGVYANPMILMALAPHVAELNRIPTNLRSKDHPKGALILAIQAVERGLTLYRKGVKASTTSPAMWFSEDNWGNMIKLEHGEPKHHRRATKYLKVIDNWKAEKWEYILNGAKAYCIDSFSESNKGRLSTAPIIVDDEDDDYYIISD